MALKGLNWMEAELTTASTGWVARRSVAPYSTYWNLLITARNTWAANKSNDRYNHYYKGSPTSPFPRGAVYDPTRSGEKIRDAAFTYLVNSFSPTPSEVTAANAGKRAVITEIIDNIINAKYTYNSVQYKAFDWLGMPARWKIGYGNDQNPYFIIAEWLMRILFAWDYVKDQATTAEEAEWRKWLNGAATVVKSWYDERFDELFVSRTGEVGSYAIRPNFASQQLSGVDPDGDLANWVHKDYKRAHVVNRSYNNRYRVEAGFVGLAGLYLGNDTFAESAAKVYKEYFAYGVYPDQSHVDTQRSRDTSNGVVKASQGYSYPQPDPWIDFADAWERAGRTPSLYSWTTNKGTTTANSGSNGNSSDGSTQKGLLSYLLNLKKIHAGEVVRRSPVSPYPIISAITYDGKEICSYFHWAQANLYYKNAELHTFLQRAIPGNQASNGGAPAYMAGQYPHNLFMYAGYGQNPTLNRFPGEQPEEKQPKRIINVFDPPDRDYVAGDIITLSAQTDAGDPVVYSVASGPAEAVDGETDQFEVTGAGLIAWKHDSPESDDYLAANPVVTHTLIRKAKPVLTVGLIPDQEVGTSFDVTFSASNGATPVATGNDLLTQNDANTFTPTAVSTSTHLGAVTVTLAETDNYLAAEPVTREFLIAPAEEPTENGTLLTLADMIPRASNPDAAKYITGSNGNFYRFQIKWNAFSTPKDLSGCYLKTGFQTGAPVFNNRLVKYKFWVRLQGAGAEEWTLAWNDNYTQRNEITRGIPFTNVIQIKLESDGYDLYKRIQVGEIYGKNHV